MIEIPEVQYVRNGAVSLAYQVVGDGPIDVIEIPGIFTHLEAKWEEPGLTRAIADLARFARVILFDRRGVGLSDRLSGDEALTLEEQLSDIRTVMAAAKSRQAVVIGIGDGGIPAAAFAARHPEATRALILYNCVVVVPEEGFDDASFASIEREWGTGVMAARMGAQDLRSYFARIERRACTPRAALSLIRATFAERIDGMLSSITAPTLILQYEGHPGVPVAGARRVAAAIPSARYVETPGYSADAVLRERRGLANAIEEFLTGTATVTDADRVLTAVLFTDIVGSTERAAELGDRRWRDLLDEHDRRIEHVIGAAGGRVIKTTGDGVLARFDGAARAVRCARTLVTEAKRIGVPVRAAVHVGECDQRGNDIAGMTVHVAARVLALAGANQVLATSTTCEALVGADIRFEAHGTHKLRGVPGDWRLFVVR